MDFKIFTDRSGLESYSRCNRLYWWQRAYNLGVDGGPGGIEPRRKSIYLVLGGAVHSGLNYLMNCCRNREMSPMLMLTGGPRPLDIFKPSISPEFDKEFGWHSEVMKAADLAVAEFRQAMASGEIYVPDATTPEQTEWKLREAKALVEGLVMVAGFRLVPNLMERFRVVEVEREKRFTLATLMTPPNPYPEIPHKHLWYKQNEEVVGGCTICGARPIEVIFESRADALLEERETGDLYVHSWKTSADYGRMEEQQFRHDVQGLTEAIAIEQSSITASIERDETGHPISYTEIQDLYKGNAIRVQGIQMAMLLKGRKGGDKKDENTSWHGLGPGLKFHYSTITHGWRNYAHGIMPEDDCSAWAWSYFIPKPENKSGQGKLGKGWEPVAIFDTYEGGTRQWILDLMAGKWQPECGDPFAQTLAMPEPWSRSDREMEDVVEEFQSMVEEIWSKAEEVRAAFAAEDWDRARHLLNRHFPKNRKSCYSYGSPCSMIDLCFGSDEAWQNPLGSLETAFKDREPHHSLGVEV